MIDNPEHWAGQYAKFASSVTFHFEAANDPAQVISNIRQSGAKVAMSIRPGTSFESVSDLVRHLDMLLIMTVEPGFGGQSLIEATVPKVSQAAEFARENSLSLSIQVDGGITADNISALAAAGADTFVAGTAVFQAGDRNAAIDRLRALAKA
jgi:ribulose-phosphate 3-epimerase